MWLRYDPAVIDRELGYVQKMGLNSVRVFLQGAENHVPAGEWLERGIAQGWTPDVVLSVGQYQGQRSLDAVLRQRPPTFRIPVHGYELMHGGGGNRTSPGLTGAGRKAFDQRLSMPLFWGESFLVTRGVTSADASASPDPSAPVMVRLAESPNPWLNPFQANPYYDLLVARHGATVRQTTVGAALVIETAVKRSTDIPLSLGAWKKVDRSNLPERPEGCCAQIGPVPFFQPAG